MTSPQPKRPGRKTVRPKRAARDARPSWEAETPVGLPSTVRSPSGGPPLPRVPAALARRFQQVCAAMLAEAIAGDEVVQLEYASLIALELEPGIDQRRLAEAVGIDPSHASLIVDRLDSLGLVVRRVSATDRRARELNLTAKGKALWRRLRLKGFVANQRILAPLAPAEREVFLDLLVCVIEGNRAHARPGGGRRKRSSVPSSST